MRIFVAGDTHGNINWMQDYVYPTAMAMSADKILVLGDFGYWEHTATGVDFMSRVDALGYDSGIALYWLAGNHDKWSLAMTQYGDKRDEQDFVICRDNILFIPNAKAWTWAGVAFRAFGGAYSVDKEMRLIQEKRKSEMLVREAVYRAAKKKSEPRQIPSQAGTLWFPEEEFSDETMFDWLTEDGEKKDIILSHDKPASSRPGWNRKELPLCVPNQNRLEAALRRHRPSYWLHGHLHYFYRDVNADTGTTIIGLDPDRAAAENKDWKHRNTWLLLDVHPGGLFDVTLGKDARLDKAKYEDAKARLAL